MARIAAQAGSSASGVYVWAAGTSWATLASELSAGGYYGTVLVERDVSARVIDAGSYDFSKLYFQGVQDVAGTPIDVRLSEGVVLTVPVLASDLISWYTLATATPVYSGDGLNFDIKRGGLTAQGASAITPFVVGNDCVVTLWGSFIEATGLPGGQPFFACTGTLQVRTRVEGGNFYGYLSARVLGTGALSIEHDAGTGASIDANVVIAPATLSRTQLDTTFLSPPVIGPFTVSTLPASADGAVAVVSDDPASPLYVRVNSVWEAMMAVSTPLDFRYDLAGNVEYFGFAQTLNSATASAVWQIFRLNNAPGNNEETVKRYADGVATFTKVWDDRATYTYGA